MPTQIPFLPIVAPDAGPQVIRMAVTKAMATEWLKLNIDNRKWSHTRIKFLMDAMSKDGGWDENSPATIAFSDIGHLIDGQHRLMALVGCGRAAPLMMWVSFNVPHSSRKKIDCGWTRTLAVRAEASKEDVAVINCLHSIRNNTRAAMTIDEYEALAAQHTAGLAWLAGWSGEKGFCRAQVRCAVMELWEANRERGREFRRVLLEPDVVEVGHPAYALRKKINEWVKDRNMPTYVDLYRYCAVATKAALQGRSLKILKLVGDGK